MTHFLIRYVRLGGHVHVGIWAGTELQAANWARPKLGALVMDPDQWTAFQALIGVAAPGVEAVVQFEEGPGVPASSDIDIIDPAEEPF